MSNKNSQKSTGSILSHDLVTGTVESLSEDQIRLKKSSWHKNLRETT